MQYKEVHVAGLTLRIDQVTNVESKLKQGATIPWQGAVATVHLYCGNDSLSASDQHRAAGQQCSERQDSLLVL